MVDVPHLSLPPLVRAEDARAADAAAPGLGVPAVELMRRAGTSVATVLRETFPAVRHPLILCGSGNNGGDGYVVASVLRDIGLAPIVLAVHPHASRSDAAEGARKAWSTTGAITELTTEALDEKLNDSDLVVDALLGTGLSRPLQGLLHEVAVSVNSWPGPVLAIDVPSGVDADAAQPPGTCIQADRTVQLAWACAASALAPARFAFGTTTVHDIGMPPGALPVRKRPYLFLDDAVARAWPATDPMAHKYQAGTVLVVAGSERWSGAGELACRGAHRAGAGLVTLVSDAPHPSRWPETIVLDAPPQPGDLARLVMTVDARHQAARVIGPGLDPARIPELGDLLERDDVPTVLDATALDPSLKPVVVARRGTWLTPHVGEAARLLGLDVETVLQHPLEAARDLATTWNAGVVLKTAGAVVAAPNGSTYVVAAGHPGMASGGTGDVLAGALGAALASLAAADHDAARDWTHASMRVAAAVQLHARAGEDAGRSLGVGFTAHELADTLPRTRQRLMGAW